MLKFHITNSGSGTSYRPLVTPHRLDTFVVLSPLQRDIRMNTTTQFRVAEMGAIQGWKNKFNATTCGNVELCVYTPDKKVVNMVRDAGGVHSVEVKVDRKGAWSVGRVKRTGGGAFTVEFVVEYQCV
ncbi:hypothetical protein HK104_004715 [Borealophlyctis nickersoniae]|nr:hypothetical protein HK104_004715 [Borealophlyctis nickersoniae]